MLMCTRCKKRPAVVFVSNSLDGNPQGLCLVCAKELGIKPVNDIMQKMGITDEDLEAATEQMTELMNINLPEDEDDEDDDFDEDEEDCYASVCPSCGDEIYFDDSVLESGEVVCPGCGTKLNFDLSSLEESETDKNE